MDNFSDYITTVDGFPTKGVSFKDITTLLEQPGMLAKVAKSMSELVPVDSYDKIVCADARGFIFGTALAMITSKPLVLVRKKGKLPRPGYSVSYDLEYGNSTLQVSAGSITEGDRCLVVDDILATGGTADAVKRLIELSSGTVSAFVFFIELAALHGRELLNAKVLSVLTYGIAVDEKALVDLDGIVDDDQLRYYGNALLPVIGVSDDYITCSWRFEDRILSRDIPKNKIKEVINIDGVSRRYIP